jgi:hypothetical protein
VGEEEFEGVRYRPNNLIRRDFDTHEQLHDILRRSDTTSEHSRHVEISVDCGADMVPHAVDMAFRVWELYDDIWVDGRVRAERESEEMLVTFRVNAIGEQARSILDSEQSPFVDEDYGEEFWKGRTWGCLVRGKVTDEEKKWWTEGEV